MCITTSSTVPPQITTAPVAMPGTTTPSSHMPGLLSDASRQTLRRGEVEMVDNRGRRRTASFPGAFAFMALAITACGSTGPESSGAGSTVAATLHVCESCPGRDGRSISPTFPRLAGQQKNYIVEQLKAFRDKTRADPHARTYMWGLAAGLSDPTIDAIAD